jgi:hypothetical protein
VRSEKSGVGWFTAPVCVVSESVFAGMDGMSTGNKGVEVGDGVRALQYDPFCGGRKKGG